VILVWGPPDDPPVERVIAALEDRSADFVHLDDSDLGALQYDVMLAAQPSGWIELARRRVALDCLRGMYLRPRDPTHGVAAVASSALLAVAASLPAAVVNRPAAGASNLSKPFQLGLIAAAGFDVPETLVTTDPVAARDFLETHGRLVYKSTSGVRSIVGALGGDQAKRLDAVRTGPVQLQRWIDGLDVRVHVVGDQWFTTAIESEADDYRYAARQGIPVAMAPYEIGTELGDRLVALTQQMGLLVSGVDLRLTRDGAWYCLEVNPSPGFTYFQDGTGQPIAEAIADLLIRGVPAPFPPDTSTARRHDRRPSGPPRAGDQKSN
jgi:glutathione synthase/RimK-type ligase-like ATP-grasp enzyme